MVRCCVMFACCRCVPVVVRSALLLALLLLVLVCCWLIVVVCGWLSMCSWSAIVFFVVRLLLLLYVDVCRCGMLSMMPLCVVG